MSDAASAPADPPPAAPNANEGGVAAITLVVGGLDLTPEEREHARLNMSITRKAEAKLRPLVEATDNPEKLDAFEALLALARHR